MNDMQRAVQSLKQTIFAAVEAMASGDERKLTQMLSSAEIQVQDLERLVEPPAPAEREKRTDHYGDCQVSLWLAAGQDPQGAPECTCPAERATDGAEESQ
jgi:hypothetical protein